MCALVTGVQTCALPISVKVAPQEKDIKVPAWLNDPIYYHNRGNSTFTGESSTMGDFVGLDDLMTENPRVVQGFIDIYGDWIDTYKVDGFRIDTEIGRASCRERVCQYV